jgi:hypothetical protein
VQAYRDAILSGSINVIIHVDRFKLSKPRRQLIAGDSHRT